MTHDGQKIDWRKILLEMRDSYTCDDSVHGDSDARYQSEFESYSQRMAERFPNFEVDRREDAERQGNIFAAIKMYYNVAAPIPPELIATLLSLYNDVYLGNEGRVSLEQTFFGQHGKAVFAKSAASRRRNGLDAMMIKMGTHLDGKSQIEVATELAEKRGVDPESIVRRVNRNRSPED